MKLILLLTVYIWIFLGITISKAHALNTDSLLHPAAHAGGSYVLTHIGTVACKHITGLSTMPCSLIAGSLATGAGIAVEMSQDQSKGNWKRGIAYDISGVLLSIGVIHLDF